MKKLFLPLSVLCLSASFIVLSAFNPEDRVKAAATVVGTSSKISDATSTKSSLEFASNKLYDSLQLNRYGLSRDALKYAYRGQQYMADRGMLKNNSILTVCDFSQPSSKKRMYIIDVMNYRVLINTYVAHGKNSGLQHATKFSNRHESLQSSLGFYVTKSTYFGKHGLSLRLAGKERGYNDNAESRAVVVHGATYIGDNRLGSAYMGRSFGCPAVPQVVAPKVIDLIKNGSCLFIYKPDQRYLHASRILNG